MVVHWNGGTGCSCPGTQACPGKEECCGGCLALASRNRGYVQRLVAPAPGLRRKRAWLCWWCAGLPSRARHPKKRHTRVSRAAIREARLAAEEEAAAGGHVQGMRRPAAARRRPAAAPAAPPIAPPAAPAVAPSAVQLDPATLVSALREVLPAALQQVFTAEGPVANQLAPRQAS